MLTDAQQKFLELVYYKEELVKKLKELNPKLEAVLLELGEGHMFQDPNNNLVFRVSRPIGKFINFDLISYERTKKPEETKGSLSKKEAEENGFIL